MLQSRKCCFKIFYGLLHFRKQNEANAESKKITVIEDITPYDKMAINKIQEDRVDEKRIISTGFMLITTVKKLDKALAPMITNTYFSCILLATTTFYSSTGILFKNAEKELILSCAASLAVAILAIVRLFRITQCGYILEEQMKECAHLLDRFKFKTMESDENDVALLKQDLRYHSASPINPYSAFSVSTSTLVATFGTIVTYLIVLLQFKVSEPTTDTLVLKNATDKNITALNLTAN